MLIYLRSYGQLCNRIWSLVPSISYAVEHMKKVHLVFNNLEDTDTFPTLYRSSYVKTWVLKDSRFISSVLYRVFKVLDVKSDLKDFTVNRFSLKVINSWKHTTDVSFVSEHREELVKLFSFNDDITGVVDTYFDGFSGITVGVHVRHGDYKNWRGGKYYYSNKTYIDYIKQVAALLENTGKSYRFLICTNEPFDCNIENLDIFKIPDATGLIDLCALSSCDYIIGPPSSFSQWASFYGNVPLRFVLSSDENISLKDFSPIVRFTKFSNGKQLIDREGTFFEVI